MMCYENCCRLCLKELSGPGIDCTAISELKDSLADLFDIEVVRTDITRCICAKCFENAMTFKAFKKTVAECQKIIKDYETIRKKILDSRTLISIKQEVIDLSAVKTEPTQQGQTQNKSNKRKQNSFPNSVTDSQINDILNIVHDNSRNRHVSVSSSNLNKRPRTATPTHARIKMEQSTLQAMDGIHITISDDDDDDNNGNGNNNNGGNSEQEIEPISSTSRDTKSCNGTETRSDSMCSTSTSAPSTSDNAQSINNNVETLAENQCLETETVSSSVQTPVDEQQKTVDETPVQNATANIPASISNPHKNNTNDNDNDKDSNTDNTTNTNPLVEENNESSNKIKLPKPDKKSLSNNVETKLKCPECQQTFENADDCNAHITQKHRDKKEKEKKTKIKNKLLQSAKDEHVTMSSEEENLDALYGRGHPSRQAKSQALRRLSLPHTHKKTSGRGVKSLGSPVTRSNTLNNNNTNNSNCQSPQKVSKQTENQKTKNDKNITTPNATSPNVASQNAIAPNAISHNTISQNTISHNANTPNAISQNAIPQNAIPPNMTPPNTTPSNNKLKPTLGDPSLGKRVITITLFRTKDSVNFRYCDQYKKNIDFDSVTSEELKDIRSSLLIPEIWSNLKNVFKTSPPDTKTVSQLKTIFGDKFHI